jgi:hypothetical protein
MSKVTQKLWSALQKAGRDRELVVKAIDETHEWALSQAGDEDWSQELRLHLDEQFGEILHEVQFEAADIQEYEWAAAAQLRLKSRASADA